MRWLRMVVSKFSKSYAVQVNVKVDTNQLSRLFDPRSSRDANRFSKNAEKYLTTHMSQEYMFRV